MRTQFYRFLVYKNRADRFRCLNAMNSQKLASSLFGMSVDQMD